MYDEIKQVLLEVNRWTKLAMSKKLSPASINKLHSSGIVRPASQIASGLNRGSHKIAQKHGIKRYNRGASIYQDGELQANITSPITFKNKVFIDKNDDIRQAITKSATLKHGKPKTSERLASAILNRHETEEAKKIQSGNPVVVDQRYFLGHAAGVLKNEKKIRKQLDNIYGYNDITSDFRKGEEKIHLRKNVTKLANKIRNKGFGEKDSPQILVSPNEQKLKFDPGKDSFKGITAEPLPRKSPKPSDESITKAQQIIKQAKQ